MFRISALKVASVAASAVVLLLVGIFLLVPGRELSHHPLVAAHRLSARPPVSLPMPVVGVSSRYISDSWGAPRSEGRRHQGIDIFAPRGRAIVSTTSGIVTTIGSSRRGGNVVWIFGPGGQWHYYAHLESFGGIRVGQVVVRGTVIGYVGDTGNAKGTPPHLHYGVYRFRGGAINPYPLLIGASRNRGV